MEITWVKLKTKMFDDEKIQLIESMPEADAVLVIWIKLLIQAGKINQGGFISLSENIPYTTEMLSTIFRRPLQIVKFALKTLTNFGMIEVTDSNVICISNWEKHQNIEGLDKVRENNRIRQARFREQKRLLQEKNGVGITLQSRDITPQIKIKREIKKEEIIIGERMLIIKDYFLDLLPIDLETNKILAWADWVDYRKETKKKLVRSTAKQQIKFLLAQPNFINCINQSIKNQWQGLFEEKQNGTGTNKQRRKDYVTKDEYESELKSLYEGGAKT